MSDQVKSVQESVKLFAEKVLKATEESYPSFAVDRNRVNYIWGKEEIPSFVAVYTMPEPGMASMSFDIVVDPMFLDWIRDKSGIYPYPTIHEINEDTVRVFRSQDGKMGLARCRFVYGNPNFVVPATTPYGIRDMLKTASLPEREHWLTQNTPKFYYD